MLEHKPLRAYPASKVRTEALLRIASVYDPVHSPLIAEPVARISEHRLIAHFYPGLHCAGPSFVHLDDLAEAIARVVRPTAGPPPELPLLLGEAKPAAELSHSQRATVLAILPSMAADGAPPDPMGRTRCSSHLSR
ncbi:hypothetical protein [Microvirga sp. G4-2]|uniref:hypothetical protein n=1 Tax=Microvirga sp. G4-2 TaxID=3434467 RepID=UPI004044BBAC